MTSPPLAREMPDGTRRYVHPVTGETVPSVTTVLKVLAKDKLIGWAASQAAKYACEHWEELGELPSWERARLIREAHVQVRERTARAGDEAHEMVQAWMTGVPFPGRNSRSGQLADFMVEVAPRFIENEVTLWSRTYGYAGTCDWIADIGGVRTLGDSKTGRGVYPEAALQVAALAGTDFIMREDGTEQPLPATTALAVLHLRPRSWKLIPVSYREECFAAFLAALRLWTWEQDTAPYVLGAA